jgi:arylsulfatase A-like enzyme
MHGVTYLRFVVALPAVWASVPGLSGEPGDLSPPSAERPNIVLLLADDLGWRDVGFHGSEIATPHLDRLAAEGTQLDQFYVQPVCSPTRGALLTGRYPMRLGLQCGVVRPWARHGLPLCERPLSQVLLEAGYVTAICGKWHLGHARPEFLPGARGFVHQYGHYNGMLDYFTHLREGILDWHRDDQPLVEEGYTTTLIGREATRLLRDHDFRRPLFLYVPFNAPHTPLQVPDEYLERYADISSTKRRKFAAMVTALDDAVGQIVAELDRRQVRERTLILFCSDNGGPRSSGANNGPLRGGKGRLYEGGVRVPALVNWPGTVPAGRLATGMAHIVDLYPTLATLAGASLQGSPPLDGLDIWPIVREAGHPSPRTEMLLNTSPFHGAIRVGDWKLVWNGHVGSVGARRSNADRYELFDLSRDPYERTDLAEVEPERLRSLRERLEHYARQAAEPHILPSRMPADFRKPEVWGQF